MLRDWLTGSSDPEGLLDFIRRVEEHIDGVVVRHGSYLHAKMILSDGSKAMAGSGQPDRWWIHAKSRGRACRIW